jgi:hypothetical protein
MADHPIVHIELASRSLDESGKFYAEIFGWKTERTQWTEYMTWDAPPGPGGGFAPVDGKDYKPGTVLIYINTEDIDATLAQIEAHGGKTIAPKGEIPTVGWYAIFEDPTGNRVALFTPMMH